MWRTEGSVLSAKKQSWGIRLQGWGHCIKHGANTWFCFSQPQPSFLSIPRYSCFLWLLSCSSEMCPKRCSALVSVLQSLVKWPRIPPPLTGRFSFRIDLCAYPLQSWGHGVFSWLCGRKGLSCFLLGFASLEEILSGLGFHPPVCLGGEMRMSQKGSVLKPNHR